MKRLLLVISLLLVLFVSACSDAAPAEENAGQVESTATTSQATAALEQAATPFPPAPLDLTFNSDDGVELIGRYWPPASEGAPVIVLMHQYNMDHIIEWVALAPWLQNRESVYSMRTGADPWSDPSWFVPWIEGLDHAVFAFTFRNCLGGCNNDSVESKEEWIVDGVSAIKAAGSFLSVDAQKIIVVGTSIGADAAVDACARLLDDASVKCVGVIALSPNSYLDVDYAETVKTLTEAGVQVRCVASEDDDTTAETCRSYEGENYEAIIVSGSSHGIHLFDPKLDVDVSALLVQSIIEWTLP